ncbi:MAG: Na+/H+ antiporter subunit E [Ilumatobacteraceae bacterium]
MTRALTLVGGLAALWVLLWGSASAANVLGGLLVGAVLVTVVPGLGWRTAGARPPRPLAVLHLLGHAVVTSLRSNVELTREVLARRSQIHTGVVEVELPVCSDGVLTLITNLLALAPGSMPLEVTRDPYVLYVHVLHLHDVDQVRRDILRLTELTLRAFPPPARQGPTRRASAEQGPPS